MQPDAPLTYVASADQRTQILVPLTDRQHRRVWRMLRWNAHPLPGVPVIEVADADAWIEAERAKRIAKGEADKRALGDLCAGRITAEQYAFATGQTSAPDLARAA